VLAAGRCGNVIRTLTPLVTSEEKLRGRLAILGRGAHAAPSLVAWDAILSSVQGP
jgi:hypothetical protein